MRPIIPYSFFSAVADIELLKRGDIFIGTLASHFSKLLYASMVGYQMRMLPFISLDFPMVCDTIDACSDNEVLGRNQTIEEIVLRNPACERAGAIRSNLFAESGLAGWLPEDKDNCNIYNGPAVQFYQHVIDDVEARRRVRHRN